MALDQTPEYIALIRFILGEQRTTGSLTVPKQRILAHLALTDSSRLDDLVAPLVQEGILAMGIGTLSTTTSSARFILSADENRAYDALKEHVLLALSSASARSIGEDIRIDQLASDATGQHAAISSNTFFSTVELARNLGADKYAVRQVARELIDDGSVEAMQGTEFIDQVGIRRKPYDTKAAMEEFKRQ